MDRKAREELYLRTHRDDIMAVREVLMKYESDFDLVDDLTQETFAQVWDNLDAWREEATFLTWVCSIAYKVGADWQRRQSADKRRHEVLECYIEQPEGGEYSAYYDRGDLSMDVAESSAAQDPLLQMEAEEAYARAVQAMPPTMAMAVAMRRDGIHNPEIARELGVSEKTVRNLVSESHKYFRDNSQVIAANVVSERDGEPLARAARLSQSDVERAAQDRFEQRCAAFEKRRIRELHPACSMAEWKEMYHA